MRGLQHSEERSMRFGVVGAGVIGQMRARSVTLQPGAELAAVSDPNLEAARVAAAGTQARIEADHRAFLSDGGLDAVIVSTPVQLHEAIILEALTAGKHVLCEKPLSNSPESCRRILDAAKRSGKHVAVGFNHRFYPAFLFMKRAIEAGRIGKLDEVRTYGGHDGLHNFRADWMYKRPHSGGGAMMDVGIHMTDLARWMAGDVVAAFGAAGENVWHVEGSEDRAVAVLRTASGVPIQYGASWNEWKGYKAWIEAYGDRGMIRAQYGPMFNLLIEQDKPGAPRRKTYKPYLDVALREKLKGWETTTQLSFQAELAELMAKLTGGVSLAADVWDGVQAVEIADAVYQSTRSGQVVSLRSRDA
jgi:predicted dehydrogenase